MKVIGKSPGKLYIGGEYAVVETAYPAVIASVDRYVRVVLSSRSGAVGTLHSNQEADQTFDWHREEGRVVYKEDMPFQLVAMAQQVAERYLAEKGQPIQWAYDITIQSDLDHVSGQKFGLGSSGAVTVAVIQAVLNLGAYPWQPIELYKLSVMSQLFLHKKGSFGDLAASSFGGVIAYTAPDRAWLRGELKTRRLSDLVQMEWEGLSILPLEIPRELQWLVGWTGRPASTDYLVQAIQDVVHQEEREIAYVRMLEDSRICVVRMIEACRTGHAAMFMECISENRRILQEFEKGVGTVIETPLLQQLCQLAIEQGGVAKSSGAGGGDCGIAFVDDLHSERLIREAWSEAGILPLEIRVAERVTYGN
ncbi:phosphomevalonate kinase [Streptococcus sp. DD13]|uniref:phosphomevalonate kinase n=1 Tax=Streptococcus sp. DD13 TaxID=1777881 RepID=UPI00079C0E3C|nr:phosphomevalonate kinase [Streptococcus sp. DD13]KXT78006.1 Phosphomevalonate kinase [Streptococcus sp. DD13]